MANRDYRLIVENAILTLTARGRRVGNLPQAFSHLTLIGAAYAIAAADADAAEQAETVDSAGW